MPGKPYFEAMRERALAKLEGSEGLRAWIEWAKKELPREYACRIRYGQWKEAETNLRIAEGMLSKTNRKSV